VFYEETYEDERYNYAQPYVHRGATVTMMSRTGKCGVESEARGKAEMLVNWDRHGDREGNARLI